MGNDHIISIEKEAKLSIDTGRLEICFLKEQQKYYFACCDIAVVILAHPCVALSVAVLKELAQYKAIVINVNDQYMPVALSIPIGVNQEGAKRPHQQAKYIGTDIEKRWLDQLLRSKVLGQAFVLSLIDVEKAKRLYHDAEEIYDGDKNNIEASSARFYWEHYMNVFVDGIKKREKKGAEDIVNVALNYGYAIIRSMIARALVSFGLCLNFGVGHIRKDNPFNLVEDMMEPFRYVVDQAVFKLLQKQEDVVFEGSFKKQLLKEILQTSVEVQQKTYRLFQAMDEMVHSFCLSLIDPRRSLLLPHLKVKRLIQEELFENLHIKYEAE